MTFYIFNCSTDKSLYGVTDDATGAKLPRSKCPDGRWVLAPGELNQSAIGFNVANANWGLAAQGFHLFRVKVEVKGP